MARFPFQAKPHISKVLAGLEDPSLGWLATRSRRLRPEWVSRSSACQRGAVGTEDTGGSATWAGVSLLGLTSPSPSGLFLPPLPSSLPPSSLGLPGSPPLFHGEGESLSSLPGRSDLPLLNFFVLPPAGFQLLPLLLSEAELSFCAPSFLLKISPLFSSALRFSPFCGNPHTYLHFSLGPPGASSGASDQLSVQGPGRVLGCESLVMSHHRTETFVMGC